MRYTLLLLLCVNILFAQDIHIRTNIIGYFPEDTKRVLLMSDEPIRGKANLVELKSQKPVFRAKLKAAFGRKWGQFPHQYLFDFTEYKESGQYIVKYGSAVSDTFSISLDAYGNYQEDLLAFMRQQRCGYNPYYDAVCHQRDGRIYYAPVPDSTYFDFSGGWHDAGDQLKYLITASNATARMLLAYELAAAKFIDEVDANGHPQANGVADILDEAKWGLDWLLKLHPKADWLVHQIADDRDHRGFKFPYEDNAEYGWGPNSYRAAYLATGKPQGLGKWKSQATGIANLAGRSAAALAMGARIWRKQGLDQAFVLRCQKAAEELYQMGMEQEGFQQGNSYGMPYRYNEDTWADDMEWGAVELFKLTKEERYLQGNRKVRYLSLRVGRYNLDPILLFFFWF